MRAIPSRRTLHLCGMALVATATLQFVTGAAPRFDASAFASQTIPGPSEPVHSAPAAASRRTATLSPQEADILFAIAHRTADSSQANALFAAKSWYTPPPPPPQAAPVETVPTAPPLPFTFLGSYTDANSKTVYFLTRDDRVFDVRPGDVIDAMYSVVAVENGQLVILYKPLDTRQMLPIGELP